MKYVLVALVLASVAGAEFVHERWLAHGPDATVCAAPQTQREALRELLLQHVRSH